MESKLSEALWKIYRRPDVPKAWTQGGNLPWNDPDFSIRMLREHLDESHGAASRQNAERTQMIEWQWVQLGLQTGMQVYDVTCGPGLYAVEYAKRGCTVQGVDFAPASIEYARELAEKQGVAEQCTFIESDVRDHTPPTNTFDAALFLYGQLAVFPKEEAQQLLTKIVGALKPGGRLCIELLNPEKVDKKQSNWWFTDNQGLWGDTPFLHLGERFWDDEQGISTERFYVVALDTGAFTEIHLSDQTYAPETMCDMMKAAGFAKVDVYMGWDDLPLYDAEEWIVYIAEK